MALEREEVCAFVFRPLNGAEAYLSCFEGDCKDTNGYFVGEKGIGEFRYRVQDLWSKHETAPTRNLVWNNITFLVLGLCDRRLCVLAVH